MAVSRTTGFKCHPFHRLRYVRFSCFSYATRPEVVILALKCYLKH